MNTLSITKIIEIKWEIFGFPGYVFGSDKNLYNLKTLHKIKMTVKGYAKGYQIKNKLRPLLKKPEFFNLSF